MTRHRSELNWLSNAAARANDGALAKVVSMLDQLQQRGEADAVLATVRQRLRGLRPARPLGFTRLLFLPLDGAIVPSARWRRGEPSLPRSALPPLAAEVQRQLGAAAETVMARCEGRTTRDTAAAAEIGATLWPEAALLLPRQPPAEWQECGLTAADYTAIADLCRALWQNGPALLAAMAAGEQGPPLELAEAALQPMQAAGPQAMIAALGSVLLRAREPGRVATLAARLEPAVRPAAQAALERMVDDPLPPLDLLDTGGAVQAMEGLLARLDDLAECGLLAGERQHRVTLLRRAADEACRERFLAGAEAEVVAPAARLLAAPQVEPAAVTALEQGARELRALQQAGRRLGGAAAYDKAMEAVSTALAALAPAARGGNALRRMDLARTVEILCGPDAAQRLLDA
jgi:hypothetical protein